MFCSKPRNTQNFVIFPFDSFVAGVLVVLGLLGHVGRWSALRIGGLVSWVGFCVACEDLLGGGVLRGREI